MEHAHGSFLHEITSGGIEGAGKAKIWLILGGIAVVVFLVWKSKQSSAPQNYLPYAAPGGSGSGGSSEVSADQIAQIGSKLDSAFTAVQQQETALASIAANQNILAKLGAAAAGVQTWLSCCDPTSWNCEASCIKQKGGSTQGVPGSANVSNVKTENKNTFQQAAAPFYQCQLGAGWDWGCVGLILEGNPTLQTVSWSSNPSIASRTAGIRRAPSFSNMKRVTAGNG